MLNCLLINNVNIKIFGGGPIMVETRKHCLDCLHYNPALRPSVLYGKYYEFTCIVQVFSTPLDETSQKDTTINNEPFLTVFEDMLSMQ